MLYEFVLTMLFTFAIVTIINFVVTRLLTNKEKREKTVYGVLLGQSILIAFFLTWVP